MAKPIVAIVGRPNVGKSTMMNKLIEEKVAIVSNKSGTTRDRIKGIVNKGENQYIFMDTPGIHKPRHLLGEHMTNVALETLKGVDAIMFLLDGTQEISTGDEFVNDHVKAVNTPVVLVINKIDKLSDQEIQDKLLEIKEKLGDFDKIITIAAEYGIGMHKIYDELREYLTSDVWYYPEDMYTDISINKMIREIVREKLLFYTKDEIPHSIAIEIIDIDNTPKLARYDINIYVERDSQKGIIIGKDGNLLKKVGREARLEIENLLEKKVFLNLWVKVKKNWRKKKDFLKELGYDE